MRLPPFAYVLLLLVVAPGCGVVEGIEEVVAPGETFSLRETQCAGLSVPSIRMHFLEVISDDRCPEPGACLTSGEARVRLRFFPDSDTPVDRIVDISGFVDAASGDHEAVVVERYRVALLQLDPYPDGTGERDGVPWTATFRYSLVESEE